MSNDTDIKKIPRCAVCGKRADELPEYVQLAKDEGWPTAREAVIHEEGTYNPISAQFYCTSDYIKIGMPTGVAP